MSNVETKPVRAKDLLNAIVAEHYQSAWDAKNAGEKVGWCASNFPQEICETMGIKVVYPENQAAAIAAKGGGERMCETAENNGYSNDICAYARISLAYMDVKDAPELNMPQPDFVLCCNNICNCMIKWYENIAKELNIPMILIDIPYNNDYNAEQDRIDYVRGQFNHAIKQLEEITGKKWDEKRFKEVMEISQRTGKAWLAATSMSRYEPSPFSGFDVFNHMAVAVCARGKKESAEAFELLLKEFQDAADQGITKFNKGVENYRILFEGIACWPHLRHTFTTLKESGVNVTGTVYADAFGYIYENTDQLMQAYCYPPNSVSFERAVDMRVKAIKENHCDGALIHINRSCKQWSGITYAMEREIKKQTGVPTAIFDGDQADPRNFSEAQYDTRVQGLIEVMDANKEAK